jgi:Transposase DDE domain
MDREIWRTVVRAVDRACRAVKDPGRRPVYSNNLVAKLYLWSVWRNLSLSQACDPERGQFNTLFRPRTLPSVSQFTRRVKSDVTQEILNHVHRQLSACGIASDSGYFDGKPMAVSPVSKDPDAARGHVPGGYAKGYKLHAYVNDRRRIVVWSVTPLNVDEKVVAMELCDWLPPPPAGGVAVDIGDSNYDSAPLHKREAQSDRLLLTPLRGQDRVKPGPDGRPQHHPVTLRQMGPQRREAVGVWERQPHLAKYVLKSRNNIEGVFSVMTVALDAGSPPAHVRRLHRVRRWAGAKIILYNARLAAQEKRAA